MLKKQEYFKIKTIKELWTHEKSTFRFWIILFFVGLVSLFILSLAQIIVLGVNFNEIAKNYKDANPTLDISNNFIARILFVWPCLFLLIITCIIIFYISSLIDSYREKDFSKLSPWVFSLSFFILFYHICSIIASLFNNSRLFDFSSTTSYEKTSSIINFVYIVISIAVCGYLRREVLMIRKAFLNIHAQIAFEKMQKELMERMKNFDLNSPFANVNFGDMQENQFNKEGENSEEQTKKTKEEKPKKSAEELKKEQEIQKLLDLPNERLFKIAQMLNIFDYEKLSKQELAEKIYFYTEMENKEKDK